jgi:hypothetical protein
MKIENSDILLKDDYYSSKKYFLSEKISSNIEGMSMYEFINRCCKYKLSDIILLNQAEVVKVNEINFNYDSDMFEIYFENMSILDNKQIASLLNNNKNCFFNRMLEYIKNMFS